MRIVVKGDDANIDLVLPTPFLYSRLGIKLISKYCGIDQSGLTPAQMSSIAKNLKSFRKKHKGWVLIEVDSDDYKVVIKL